VETVLGLSVTSNSVGWVLLDGRGTDPATLDDDVFDVSVSPVDDGDIATYVAAVQGVQAIAATSGHELRSIGLTWTAGAAATANLLLTSLPDLGFEKVVSVRLSEAAATWAQLFDAALGFEKAVCVVEPSAATLLSFGCGAVHTSATQIRESDDGLSRWLKDAFDVNHLDPEHLFLIGSRGDVGLISERLSETLGMPVVTSNEAQLILARGTALMVGSNAETVVVPSAGERPAVQKSTAAGALGRKLAWFSPPARAAVTLMAGVVALFVLGPMLLSQPESPSTEDQSATNPSGTSVVIQAVPALPLPPPAKEVVKRIMKSAPTPIASRVSAPPVAEVSAPEATAAEGLTVPAEVPHLPAEGTPHLPGAAPGLAAELSTAQGAPAPTTPTQAAPVPVWSALP
jgi:hypothetical protein